MDIIKIDNILETRSDTKQYVLKLFKLDKPGILEESIDILHEWVQKQAHFNKKDFSRRYLETAIVVNKGSLERAKLQIDKLCTMRTLLPQYFGKFNAKTDFDHIYDVAKSILLPKLTDDHYRLHVLKFYNVDWKSSQAIHYYRHNIMLGEYVKAHDYVSGFIIIIDFLDANLLSYLTKINPFEMKQMMSILIDGYGMRIKAVHILSQSKSVEALVALLKSVISAKIVNRIIVHKRYEELHEFIPKHLLPEDFGGEERSVETLQNEWIDLISTQDHLNYLEEMCAATTNESLRQKDQFSEHYAGMQGTFKYLSVD